MIFSSYEFLLGFLPPVYLLFLLLRRFRLERPATAMLVLASLIFYGVWDWTLLPLLVGSIVGNYLIGQQQAKKRSKPWLVLAVTGNLALLGYFKYAGFLFSFLPGADSWNIILPLGISFFTFQQIAWHADLYQRRIQGVGSFISYAFFISFFPQLIAGPIVHARTLLPQIKPGWFERTVPWHFGLTLLTIGLMKKVLIADALAPGVDALFARAAAGEALVAPEVLLAGFSYGMQLYFDFSGYADMAMGLGLMFGIKLPINFLSPYKSRSPIEFWRRWHITLSRFLRDYLYIVLGGNRRGRVRRYVNLMSTMLLGGLWHGAGWQFVLWGGLHGAFLVVNHAWRRVAPKGMPALIALPLTLTAVMLAWIPFRAESLAVAASIYAGAASWSWPWSFSVVTLLNETTALEVVDSLPWVTAALIPLVIFAPGSRQLCLRLGPTARGLLVGVGLFLVLKALAGEAERAFIYFNF